MHSVLLPLTFVSNLCSDCSTLPVLKLVEVVLCTAVDKSCRCTHMQAYVLRVWT